MVQPAEENEILLKLIGMRITKVDLPSRTIFLETPDHQPAKLHLIVQPLIKPQPDGSILVGNTILFGLDEIKEEPDVPS